jgi:ankyrin repeat protein
VLADSHWKLTSRLPVMPNVLRIEDCYRVARIDSIWADEVAGRSGSNVADNTQKTPAAAPPRKHLSGPPAKTGDTMNEIQQAAFELRLNDLKQLTRNNAVLEGTLLAACSAHDPDPTNQVRVIRHLIRCGVSVNETDKNGVTPLHRAVRFRSPAAAKELIACGAEVNVVDKRTSSTPLHRAVTNTGAPRTAGKLDCAIELARLLLSSGADARLKNKNGKRAIDYVKNAALRDVFDEQNVR